MTDLADMKALFEKKAKAGDGAFAIAYALLDLSESQEATASAIQRLGNGNASTHMGAIEGLAVMVRNAGEAIATAIDGAGQSVSGVLDTN